MTRRTGNGFWTTLRIVLDSVVSVAIVVAVVVFVSRSLRGSTAPPQSRSFDIPIPKEPLPLEGAAVLGSLESKVALVEFSDFECPFCARFTSEVLPTLRSRFIDSHQVLLVFRNLPLNIHEHARAAALAAVCANQQHRFEPVHDLLFANSAHLDLESIARYPISSGVEQPSFDACLKNAGPDVLKADVELAQSLKIRGTPGFLVGTLTPDRRVLVTDTITGSPSVDKFVSAVESALSGAPHQTAGK